MPGNVERSVEFVREVPIMLSMKPRPRASWTKPLSVATLTTAATLVAAVTAVSCGDDGPPGLTAASDAGDTATKLDAGGEPGDATVTADGGGAATGDSGATAQTPRTPVKAELSSSVVTTESLLFAAGEMQISGEPFAQTFAGRNLAYYDRTYLPPNMYLDGLGTEDEEPILDLFGFSTAVESYEYSKYYMNMVAAQTGAGLSLANGPNVQALYSGATPGAKLVARAYDLLTTVGADVSGNVTLPAPVDNPQNILGFQGLWPNMAPFRTFDPTMAPSKNRVQSCSFAGGYGGIPTAGSVEPQFECAYNSLHLTDRDAQVEKVLTPGTMGMAVWKESIWAIDFVGRIHDSAGNQVSSVAPADVPRIGISGNLVVGNDPPGLSSGTFIGSTALEGTWGVFMVDDVDNAAELLLTQLSTADGATLGGFATRADALAYDYTSPLRWFPSAIGVTESESDLFPLVSGYTIQDASSNGTDYAALLLGYAMTFGTTDARNAAVGQRIGFQAAYDGKPFAADNGLPDGEPSLHDRALGVLRVAFVDLDRIHGDPATHVLMDTATVGAGGVVTRGTSVTTVALAHEIIGMRQALLSVNAAITEYGATDPDPAADAQGILNAVPLHPGGGSAALGYSAQVRATILANAQFVRDVLTRDDGTVANSATLTAASDGGSDAGAGTFVPSFGNATLETQTAAVRALTEAYLLTSDTSYRDRARLVAQHLIDAFYSPTARMFRGLEGGADDVMMTSERFAWLLSSLRETYKSLTLPTDVAGTPLSRPALEDLVQRVMKLYMNGWDDLNGNGTVDASECLASRMQNGEQALTGELGQDQVGLPTTDRDSDCVLEIDDESFGSVMAGQVHFHAP
jgi:hypothetical protein